MTEKPMILFVGTYSNVTDALTDYDSVMATHREGELGHVAAAIVSRDAQGKLQIHRHDTTAKHLAWGGAIVGGLVGVLYPPLGAVLMSGSLVGGMVTAGTVDAAVLAGMGGVMGHYWRNIPKQDLRELGDTLEMGQAALVVVAIDKEEAEIERAIVKANKRIAKRLARGDVEGAYNEAIAEARKAA